MKVVALTAGLALTVGVSLAQAAAAPGTVTPEKMKLAQQLMESAGGQDRAAATIKIMMGTLYKGLEKNMPPDQARLSDAMHEAIQEEMMSIVPQLIQATERIYAQDLTDKELEDYLAWLNSESGRSIREKSPMMVQQMAEAEVPLVQAMMPQLGQRIIDRVCAEAKCSEQDRQIVTAAMAKAMAAHPS